MKRVPFLVAGTAQCPFCKGPATVKTSKSGFAYFNCACDVQIMARGEAPSLLLLAKVHTWKDDAKQQLDVAELASPPVPGPAPAPKQPLPSPAPRAVKPALAPKPKAPEPAPPKPATSFWDKEII